MRYIKTWRWLQLFKRRVRVANQSKANTAKTNFTLQSKARRNWFYPGCQKDFSFARTVVWRERRRRETEPLMTLNSALCCGKKTLWHPGYQYCSSPPFLERGKAWSAKGSKENYRKKAKELIYFQRKRREWLVGKPSLFYKKIIIFVYCFFFTDFACNRKHIRIQRKEVKLH